MSDGPLIGGGAPGAAPVKDVTTASFMAEVVDASFDQPVIVDFWAPWCGPCKQLGPILEKVVRGANGAVRMVKLNIDDNPEIAQQMRIQSIPAVYAFKDGRPVDGFVGALPESQVKQFVDRLGVVQPHEAAEGPAPFPPIGLHRGIRKPKCAADADPHVSFRLRIHTSSHVAPDIRVGEMGQQLHEEVIPRFRGADTLSRSAPDHSLTTSEVSSS